MFLPIDLMADSLKTVMSQQEKVQNFMNSGWWSALCFVLGFLGVYLQILRRAIVSIGDTKEAFKVYHQKNHNTIIVSCISYSVIMLVWYTMGIELLGLEAFKLSLLSIVIGYQSQEIFDGWAANRVNSVKTKELNGGQP